MDKSTLSALWPQLTAVILVATSHMSLPHHWLPYVVTSRAHNWTIRKTLFLTLLGAVGHVTNTLVISLVISQIGGAFITHEQYRLASSLVLAFGALYYIYTYIMGRRDSCCQNEKKEVFASRTAEVSVVMLTTLSPCVGSMPVLVAIMKPPLDGMVCMIVALVIGSVTAIVMCTLVFVSIIGVKLVDIQMVRRHERLILGVALLVLAACNMFVFDQHTHAVGHDDGLGVVERSAHQGCTHSHGTQLT